MEAQVRGYFDSVAPRRPAKPPRSDPSDGGAGGAVVESPAGGDEIPELRKLPDLEAKPQVDAFFAVLGVPNFCCLIVEPIDVSVLLCRL